MSSEDSDFVNGAVYVYEKKPRKSQTSLKSRKRGRPRKEDPDSGSEYEALPKPRSKVKGRIRGRGKASGSRYNNPLAEYLGSDLDLLSTSEEDEPPKDEEAGESEEENAPEELSQKSRSRASLGTPVRVVKASRNIFSSSGSEREHSLKRRSSSTPSRSIKRQKVEASTNPPPAMDHSSHTESDPEQDTLLEQAKESATESSTEEEEEDGTTIPRVDQNFSPRPNFPVTPHQSTIGPFVLNEEQGIQVTESINRYLRDYQREGVKFLYDRYKEGRGGVLGDDMGLGKTIQVISFLSAIMKKIGDKRDEQRRYKYVKKLQDQKDWRENLPPPNDIWPTCLIVAPATVVHNWEREFQTWGYFEVGMYTGSERDEVLHDFKLGRLDVLLTSFEIARSDIERLDTLPFSCIFVDEAHRIKNPRSQTTQAFNQFECVIRFGLTGTAIQNDYAELWTLLDWSNPERLGTMDQWRKCVTRPLTTGQSQKATTEQLAVARRLALRLVKNLLPHFFLRRTKALIADQLPGKSHEVVFCRLTNAQLEAYKRFLSLQSVQNMILAQDLCECGSRKKRSSCHHPVEQGEALKYISVFMKISNHLVLILPSPSDNQGQATRNRELANIAFPDGAPSYGLAIFDPNLCGKWAVLNTLLQTWRREQGNKVLVFTRSVKLIEMLKYHLSREGYNYRTFDGSTKQSDRMPIIDEFSNDPDVFLFVISTLAGGTGLNLTAANKVVIFDPNWNPAHDLQAIDRAFRIGQRRDVSVYRLLAAGSLEEHIYRRQIYKQQQMAIGYEASAQTRYFVGIQGQKGKEGDLFGLKNLFTLNEDSYATKMTIEKANRDQLNWALAHFDGSVLSGIPSEELAANTGKVDAVAADDIKGLKSFLFAEEDQEDTKPSDAIATILASHGAGYMHINDDVLKPTNVEDQLTEVAIKERKRRRRSENIRKKSAQSQEGSQNSQSPPKPAWPPKRKHHKTQAPLSPRSRLYVRQHALIALGYIQEKEDLDKFAADFINRTPQEQREILLKLDYPDEI